MILVDVNVLVYAQREDAPNHREYHRWLRDTLAGPQPFGTNDHILSGVLRVLTHPRIFNPPTPLETALTFVTELREYASTLQVTPGPRHWEVFSDLCRRADAKGNLVPDAYFAALAISSGSEWVTTDRDYARFPGLKWRHPLGESL